MLPSVKPVCPDKPVWTGRHPLHTASLLFFQAQMQISFEPTTVK